MKLQKGTFRTEISRQINKVIDHVILASSGQSASLHII
jgi:hypothetical protein